MGDSPITHPSLIDDNKHAARKSAGRRAISNQSVGGA